MEKPKLVYTTYIRTTPKKVWAAITKPEFTRQYWAGLANVSDWKEGSPWQHVTKGDKPEVWITGKVVGVHSAQTPRVELGRSGRISRTNHASLLRSKPIEDLVCLTVTHDKFKTGSTMAGKVSGGWPRVLSSMKSFLETGKGLNVFGGR